MKKFDEFFYSDTRLSTQYAIIYAKKTGIVIKSRRWMESLKERKILENFFRFPDLSTQCAMM